MELYFEIGQKMFYELNELQHSIPNSKKRTEKSILLVSEALTQLRIQVRDRGFKSQEDEIHFFKTIKPEIYSHLILYSKILDIEVKRPVLSMNKLKVYIGHKKKEFRYLIQDNLEFIQYYQNEHTHFDKFYFLRNVDCLHSMNQNSIIYYDPEFSTSHSYLVANIKAFDLLIKYLESSGKPEVPNQFNHSPLTWTDSKASLVELIYAIHHSKVINNGNTEIKDLSNVFGQLFNIDLKDIYKIFHEINSRKNDRNKFINKLLNDSNDNLNEYYDLK